MIYNDSIGSDADRDALRRHLVEELRSLLGAESAPADYLDDVAATLATTWALDLGRAPVPSRVFPVLASQLLTRMGHEEEARRLLRSSMPWPACAPASDSLRAGISLSLGLLVADGLLRPSSSSVGSGPAWVLNMPRLAGPSRPVLAMEFLARLRRAVEAAVEAWAGVGGRGRLLLEGAGALHLQDPAGVPRPGEICAYCRRLLERAALARGWPHTPEVQLSGR